MAEPVTNEPQISVADDIRGVGANDPLTEPEKSGNGLGPGHSTVPDVSRPVESQEDRWRTGMYRRVGTRPRVVSTRVWTILLMGLDGSIAMLATLIGGFARFGAAPAALVQGPMYLALTATLPVLWIGAMLLGHSYDRRYLAAGTEQFRRVGNSAMWVLGAVAFASFVLRADFSRGFVAITIPVATALTLLGRWGARGVLRRRFDRGAALHRVVAVGGCAETDQLGGYIAQNRHTGFALVGTVATEPSSDVPLDVDELVADVRCAEADTIAFVGTGRFRTRELRRLSWSLQGSGIGLLVIPDLADIAGPRIEISPVEGLPLLEICEPELTGVGRLMKSLFDRAGSLVLLIILTPLLSAIAASIKLSDGGAVFYRQRRIGKDGKDFQIWKFRTMHVDAAPRFHSVESKSGKVQVLQKQSEDSRVTKAGRFLRRYSLDELPQLFNVLMGTMSLVGPRPLIPDEVDSFGHGAQLRLLVAPGMTGLWQVSGRSELSWDERVHLDLYYIENWSMWLDFGLLWRTLRVIIHSKGAY